MRSTLSSRPDFRLCWSSKTCKNTWFQHFGATCTQKHSSGSTFEPPVLKSTACAAILTPLALKSASQAALLSCWSILELKSASQAALLSCWNMQKLKSVSQAALLSCWNMQKHVDSIGLSSDSLIFPSESLCCFELCFRIAGAQFWLTYLSFGVAVLLRTVLHSDSLIFPSESLCCFELCFRIDCAQFWLPYFSFGVTALLQTLLCSTSQAP